MSVAPLVSFPHPLVVAVEQIERALDQVAAGAWDGLAPVEVRGLVERLMRVDARIRAQQIAATRVLDASGLAKAEGAASTGALLAGAFGGDRRIGDQIVRMGRTLQAAPQTEAALAKGRIDSGQAAVIASAVADLPTDTSPEQRQACEDTLIGDANQLTLQDLRRRALRITDQFKPKDEVDKIENASLERRERDAWRRSEFWMVDNRDGTHRGGFVMADAQADMLRTAIEAISAPRRDHLHDHTTGADSYYDRDLDHRHRLGRGFAELAGHLPTDGLPGNGGLGATLLVSLDYDTLINGIRPATLSTGTRISAGQARQMACNLGIIPQVFNGGSLPLDHGAEKHSFTKAQRRAMQDRDRGCTFPQCDRPPNWCEAHHAKQPWAIGKTTKLDEGVLLCAHHHRTVHNDRWTIRFSPTDGHAEFKPPSTDIWQRNHRWRP